MKAEARPSLSGLKKRELGHTNYAQTKGLVKILTRQLPASHRESLRRNQIWRYLDLRHPVFRKFCC
jgi:hypothetical protein